MVASPELRMRCSTPELLRLFSMLAASCAGRGTDLALKADPLRRRLNTGDRLMSYRQSLGWLSLGCLPAAHPLIPTFPATKWLILSIASIAVFVMFFRFDIDTDVSPKSERAAQLISHPLCRLNTLTVPCNALSVSL
ncbi:hypothetical protein DF3PB_600005 [uncultured Defluviicoccus sp.]|uniref:Uncharacterized protein n=1 Tax=metagenome TaxID=256318 RepID=A0A380TKI8_9ZZZZ|nr:hypothetical protein DF3PB_600005 [uncultured Defluviicoccus sp.]